MNNFYTWFVIAIIALVTASIRFLPFLIFSNSSKTPKIIEKLGKLLPFSVMGMLVIYCIKDVKITSISSVLPTLISSAIVFFLYLWKRNTIISILCGTICYMFLIQIIF